MNFPNTMIAVENETANIVADVQATMYHSSRTAHKQNIIAVIEVIPNPAQSFGINLFDHFMRSPFS